MRRADPTLTEKSAIARAMFGSAALRDGTRERDARDAAADIHRRLHAGEVALVAGPSGSGKTMVLRALVREPGARAVVVGIVPAGLRAAGGGGVVDLFRSPLEMTIRLLSLAGLADASVFTRCPGELSEGQRWRLGLALAMERVGEAARAVSAGGPAGVSGPVTLIVDEFASTLDRTSAMCVAVSLRRWLARGPGARVVAATSHEDMAEWLAPNLLVRASHACAPTVAGLRRETHP
jgi:uncharacterized protein